MPRTNGSTKKNVERLRRMTLDLATRGIGTSQMADAFGLHPTTTRRHFRAVKPEYEEFKKKDWARINRTFKNHEKRKWQIAMFQGLGASFRYQEKLPFKVLVKINREKRDAKELLDTYAHEYKLMLGNGKK